MNCRAPDEHGGEHNECRVAVRTLLGDGRSHGVAGGYACRSSRLPGDGSRGLGTLCRSQAAELGVVTLREPPPGLGRVHIGGRGVLLSPVPTALASCGTTRVGRCRGEVRPSRGEFR